MPCPRTTNRDFAAYCSGPKREGIAALSVRKRIWKTSEGVEKEAWVVDYVDKSEGGKRRLKTFAKKKDATAFEANANVEVRAGIRARRGVREALGRRLPACATRFSARGRMTTWR